MTLLDNKIKVDAHMLSAEEILHDYRPAYGSDGDYWSKPNVEMVFETAYEMMYEANPAKYMMFYR